MNLLFAGIFALLAAQVLKIPLTYLTHERWEWRAALRPGGMPSSHAALMMGLTTASIINYGWGSPYFSISAAVTLIVMYDAAGVRREAGQHAVVLNELTATLDSVFNCGPSSPGNSEVGHPRISLPDVRLKEVLGHKPIEIMGGALVGILTTLALRVLR